jgi:hypothetical protein
MKFWIPKILFGLILGALAYYLLKNQDLLFGDNKVIAPVAVESDQPGQTSGAKPAKQEKKAEKEREMPTNAAAAGLSKFYASINPDMSKKGPRIRKNVVYLPDPKGDLKKLLEARRIVTRPLKPSWQGSTESRPFRVGQTVFQKLSEYAGNDGLEVIWWLNRDLVVKDPFRINKDIIQTSLQLGKALSGHFIDGVSAYFCHKHRTLVFIDVPIAYLEKECTLIRSKSGYD